MLISVYANSGVESVTPSLASRIVLRLFRDTHILSRISDESKLTSDLLVMSNSLVFVLTKERSKRIFLQTLAHQ